MTVSEQDARQALDVSRETLERLDVYADLLKKWSPRINLVSKDSLRHLWGRHILDSAQLLRIADGGQKWVDLGSGAGFPGAVVAIIAREHRPDLRLTLIESDQRKAVFLRTVARETDIRFEVLAERIETVAAQNCDILSARALASLDALLGFADRHMATSGTALFQKGASWEKEIRDAEKAWRFNLEPIESQTERAAAILKITGVSRV